MKRMIALLLALMLVVGLVAVSVSAEAVKSESDTVEESVLAIGEGVPADVEMETITVYGEDVPADVEMKTVTVYGEEESGFLGWLKKIWNFILSFFGL